MISFEILNLIELAIEQAIKEQNRLLVHKRATELVPIVAEVGKVLNELNAWRRGASTRKKPLPGIISMAGKTEAKSKKLSEKLWTPIALNFGSDPRTDYQDNRAIKEGQNFYQAAQGALKFDPRWTLGADRRCATSGK